MVDDAPTTYNVCDKLKVALLGCSLSLSTSISLSVCVALIRIEIQLSGAMVGCPGRRLRRLWYQYVRSRRKKGQRDSWFNKLVGRHLAFRWDSQTKKIATRSTTWNATEVVSRKRPRKGEENFTRYNFMCQQIPIGPFTSPLPRFVWLVSLPIHKGARLVLCSALCHNIPPSRHCRDTLKTN